MNNYKSLIKNWHKRAKQSKDYFSKYVFEYLAFIAYLKTQKFSSNLKDREAIQHLKGDTETKSKYIQKINEINELEQDWQKVKDKLDDETRLGNSSMNLLEVEEIKWWNCSHDNLNQKTNIEEQKPKGIINSLEDWENMVEFWYSIRNNLFHGAKDPENEGDQFAVKYGYKTLMELMEIFLNK
jgi:hypothetical protein